MRIILIGLLALMASGATAQTIAEIQGTGDASPYDEMEVVTTGIVTASGPEGFFLQDGTGPRSGIYVYDDSMPAVGDEVEVVAVVDEFYEMTELTQVSDLVVNSTGNPLPAAELISTQQVNNEDWEGVLVRVEGAQCTNPDLGFGEWELNDGSGACAVDDLFYPFSAVQGTDYAVTGPCNYTYGAYKLFPRNAADIIIDAPVYYTALPEEFELMHVGFEIRWETNAPANSQVDYGLSPIFELGSIEIDELVTEHSVVLNDLPAGTPIYYRVRSENADGSTGWYNRVGSTLAWSSGEIRVVFTQQPDFDVALYTDAPWTANITDTIIDYISLAQATLDICMYDLNGCDPAIIEAINDRADAGVIVRYITDEEPENTVLLDVLDPEVPVLAGNFEGIMHNKFILIDRDDVDNAWVLTGSVNHTDANLGWDYNNHIQIQDQALARAFTLEFEEMWGGSGANPNPTNAVFGSAKTDNTPHKFIIGNRAVELYFSPSDGTTQQIASRLENAQDRVAFAVMAYTENVLGNAMVAAENNVGNVMGVIDYVEFNGSEFDWLQQNGVDVVDYQNPDGSQWPDGPVMHSKYAIVDYGSNGPDPVTITGSHNWTASAGSINDENTLIIHDAEIANWFYQDFTGIRNFLGAVSVEEMSSADLLVFPNPATDRFALNVERPGTLTLTDATGRVVRQLNALPGAVQVDVSDLNAGVYTVTVGGQRCQVVVE